MIMGDGGSAANAIKRVEIVGGGTAGWMAAAALSAHLAGTGVAVTLVESSDVGTVGVGEATIPTIRRFYAQLGMSDEVMQACATTAKFGIRFVDLLRPGHDFVHPFSRFGQELKGSEFHHYWLKARAASDPPPPGAYSPRTLRRSLRATLADTPTHQEFLEMMDGAAAAVRAA